MNTNEKRPPRRHGVGLALPLIVILLFVAAAAVFIVGNRRGRQQAPAGDNGGAPKTVSDAPVAKTDPAGPAVEDPAPTPPVPEPDKPRPSRAEVDELMRLAGGDAREQYKGFGGLRRMEKAGFHPDVVKQIVEHSRKLIESGEKAKVVTGVKLIEISGDYRQGEFLISTWEQHLEDKDIEFDARAALGNLLQGHRLAVLRREHPEWTAGDAQKQAFRNATVMCMPCGADPAKWRELWKTVLAEAGQDPAGSPPGAPAPGQPGTGQP
jgi:hypothetical protein